jgi:general secretion pathway protein I
VSRGRGERGFTLLEVLIALAILGTAVVAAIQGFSQGLRLLKLSGDHQEAVLLADQVVREVIQPSEGQEENTSGRFTWVRTTKLLEAPDLTPAGAPLRGKVYEIAVTVRWDQNRQVEVATLRTVATSTEAEESARPPIEARDGSLSTGARSSSLSSSASRTSPGSGSTSSSSSRSRSSSSSSSTRGSSSTTRDASQ